MAKSPAIIGKHLIIHGHVQGVSYRYYMRAAAETFQVTGWCRNLPNKTVEAQIWGRPEDIQNVLTWCEHGPPMARVRKVVIEDLSSDAVESVPTQFEILR